MFDLLEHYQINALHVRNDENSGLKAFIAIHNTDFGPALGGCRFIHYDNEELALGDAVRLARGMSYKSVMAGLEQGGGKAVIIKPKHSFNSEHLFSEFGRFVEGLGGQYITAIDSGTSAKEMDVISSQTSFVTSTSEAGNPSPYTAQGVYRGILAAVNHKLGRSDIEGLRVVVQGVGNVGFELGRQLVQSGAHVIVSDISKDAVTRAMDEFAHEFVEPELAHKLACAVYAPCGLSGVINNVSVNELGCMIIAGSANVQLSHHELGHTLHQKGILYAPDYIINSGGLIYASLQHKGVAPNVIIKKVDAIYDTLIDVFERSSNADKATSYIADNIARSRLYPDMHKAA